MRKLCYADGAIEGALTFPSLNSAICASMTDQSGQTAVRLNPLKSSESPATPQATTAQTSSVLEACRYVVRAAPSLFAALLRTSFAALT
jgi:hypothetical protein